MAAKRLTRKLTDVIAEVETQLKAHYNVTQKELDAYKKSHKVRKGTKLTVAPLTKRIGNAVSKGAAKVGDKVMNTVGKALYTTKLGNAAMKGIGHASNAVTKKMGLDNMNDKESDAEVDAWKDYYKKK